MSGLRRGVKGRVAWAVVLAVLVVSITLVSAGIALADKWTDISDAQWQSQYGVTAADAATVAGGFQDGTFHPKESVKRGQFAKMVVDGFGVAYYTPAVQTFPDVLKSNTFYKYVEGGVRAGIISGYSDGKFKPNNTVSRQQANNILGAYLSAKELDLNGVITGSRSTYTSLSAWYGAEGALILAAFKDATNVAAVHAPGTAYLVFHEVVKGSNGYLTPGSTLTRAQAVALIIRVRDTEFGGGSLPTVTGVNPAAGAATGGNGVIITGTNFTGVSGVKFGDSSCVFTVNSTTQITATAPAGTAGTTVDVLVTTTAGTSVSTVATKYSYGIPIITKLSPAGGSANGNTTVSITGSGFTGVSGVKFGNVAAKSFTVLSATQITAVSPSGANGTVVEVTVTTPAGTSAFSVNTKYTYGVPTIAKLDPAAGPATGGTTVIITGSGFVDVTGATGVKFGTVNATSYTVNSTEKITAVAPAGTAGTSVDVIVTNNIGQSGTNILENKYSYGAPTITKINPSGGPEAGGTSITITGTGFTGVSAVKFGTVAAKSFLVSSPTTMTAVAPVGTAGTTVEIYVTTPAGTNPATGTANDYSYGSPTVTGLNPAAGPTAGNNTVVITGTNFAGLTAPEQVKFGTKNALSYTVNSSTQISAVAPAQGSMDKTVNVVVTNAAGASATSTATLYSYGLPTVSSIDPAAGPLSGANSVVINGTGFTGVTAVKFGGSSVSFTVNSATKITATAPSGALDTIVEVTVTTPAGVSVFSDTTSDLTDNTKYRYILSPSVSSISPISGPVEGGNVVTVEGSYFVKGYTSVKFGTKAATDVNVISDTELTCKAPSGTSGSIVSVIVTNPVGQSPNTIADDYAYGIPTITSLNPAARANDDGSSTLVITGTAFAGVTSVRFYYDTSSLTDPGNYVEATSFTVNSLTQITAVVPNYDDSKRETIEDRTVDVVVSNGTGSSDTGPASKYAYGLPHINTLQPAGGSAAGGNSVIITGYGFTGTSSSMSVMFGATPATITGINTSPVDDPTTIGIDERNLDCTRITVTAPPKGSMASVVDVTVTTPAGTSAAAAYHYGVPTVTGVSPAAGPNGGGNSVVITGTNFEPTTEPTSEVWFGDAHEATTVEFDSPTQLTVIAPAGVTNNTSVHVYVHNAAGGSTATNADWYSFGKPTITSIEPNGGPIAGGTSVLIHGTGFTGLSGASAVKFGSVNATSYDVDETTLGDAIQEMTVVAPPGTDWVYVTVTNTAGTSDTVSASRFWYGIPTIFSMSPAAGSTAGGTAVIITGTNFNTVSESNPAAVQFGSGHNATSFDVVSSTRIDAVAPAGTGTVDVIISNASSSSIASYAGRYTYGKPTVTGLDPTGGPVGTSVTITGTGFTGLSGATAVRFGTANATSYAITDDTEIKAVAPPGTGTIDVRVANPVGTSDASANSKYTYGMPTVIGLSPGAGAAGTMVIITGTNFTGDVQVKFGNNTVPEADRIINSSVMITAIAPPSAGSGAVDGTVDVTVTNGAGTSATSASSKWSYGKPTVTLLSPDNGSASGNNYVTITGTRFTGVVGVKFGDNAAISYVVNSPTQITAKVPAGTNGTSVNVTVENDEGISSVVEPYHYGVPTITELEQASGPNGGGTGNPVIIRGTNFVNVLHVYFGSLEVSSGDYEINVSGTAITVNRVPNNSNDTIDVMVITGAGETLSDLKSKYTYGDPDIHLLNPTSGFAAGGNTVVITGHGFTGVRTVKFGGVAVSSSYVVVNSPTQITVKAPPGSVGTVSVEVTTWGGTSANTAADDYTYN
jgi:hypothetical protein